MNLRDYIYLGATHRGLSKNRRGSALYPASSRASTIVVRVVFQVC
jgi:hypothetical protein